MSKSVRRVKAAAQTAGLDLAVITMPDSTRTAEEAAQACACDVAQIVKSLIFVGTESGALKLLLVSGANQVNLDKAAEQVGETLVRADAKRVRKETGFAIGGVAPIGHLVPVETFIDRTLLGYDEVWAAAGAPSAIFKIAPADLVSMTGAITIRLS
ncbi:MAG: YbaK/EbsC family protein [Stappiaceae bacterium]